MTKKPLELKASDVFHAGTEQHYPLTVERVGLPFFCDGTARVCTVDLAYPLVIGEDTDIEIQTA